MVEKFFKHFFPFLISILFFFGSANTASAGFGISPPYLKNQQLAPGSKYVQNIMLLRSEAEEELKATVKINAPDIASWITIDKGTEFILPKGEYQVPMALTVNVPKDAELGSYKGNINIKISSAGGSAGSGVSIALGARLDVDLVVTNVVYSDFIVRMASIPDFEMLGWPWRWNIFSHFLHRARVVLNIENLGNVKTAPSKVTLDIFDITRNRLLESATDSRLKEIEPFATAETTAYFPTKLGVGQYWGRVKVYKSSTIINSYDIAFTIASPGELGGNNPSLGYYPWLLLAIYALLALLIAVSIIRFRLWRVSLKGLLLLLAPLGYILKKIGSLLRLGNINFWRWVAKKTSKYNDDNRNQ
jgi:hypothetical protein